jgi:hypothetical protein
MSARPFPDGSLAATVGEWEHSGCSRTVAGRFGCPTGDDGLKRIERTTGMS